MAGQTARNVGAGLMAGAALLVVFSIVVIDQAVRAVDRQAADLDPSQSRLAQTGSSGALGAITGAVGLLLFFVSLIILGVGTRIAGRDGSLLRQPSGGIAWAATGVLVAALLFALVMPQGPLALAIALGTGGGGAAGATQILPFDGELTGAGLVPGQAENIHPFHPVASDGAIRIRFGSGGATPGAVAIATLEKDEGGAWRTVAEARGANQTVDVAYAHYPGDLRIRVHLDPGAVGKVQYKGAISFSPRSS